KAGDGCAVLVGAALGRAGRSLVARGLLKRARRKRHRRGDRFLRHRPAAAVDVPVQLVMVGKGVHHAAVPVGDDIALRAAHGRVGVAYLDRVVVGIAGELVRNWLRTVRHRFEVEAVMPRVAAVVAGLDWDRAEDAVLLQWTEIDSDVLGDGERRVRRDLDVRVEGVDDPALVRGGRRG